MRRSWISASLVQGCTRSINAVDGRHGDVKGTVAHLRPERLFAGSNGFWRALLPGTRKAVRDFSTGIFGTSVCCCRPQGARRHTHTPLTPIVRLHFGVGEVECCAVFSPKWEIQVPHAEDFGDNIGYPSASLGSSKRNAAHRQWHFGTDCNCFWCDLDTLSQKWWHTHIHQRSSAHAILLETVAELQRTVVGES